MSVILTVGMAFSSSGFAIRSVTRFEHLPRYLLASFLLTFGIGFGLECDLVVDSIIYLHIYGFWSIGLVSLSDIYIYIVEFWILIKFLDCFINSFGKVS